MRLRGWRARYSVYGKVAEQREYERRKWQWEQAAHRAIPKSVGPVPAKLFLQQLEFLRDMVIEKKMTPWQKPFQDCIDIVTSIETRFLRPSGEWDEYWMDSQSPHDSRAMALYLIDDLRSWDPPISLRVACAIAIDEVDLPGHSFEALIQELTRAHKKRTAAQKKA